MADKKLCMDCETVGEPFVKSRGSSFVLILLLGLFFLTVLFSGGLALIFLLCFVIYLLWRIGGMESSCSACGSTKLVPLHSPAARRVLGNAAEEAEK
jgi:hypothetical protein